MGRDKALVGLGGRPLVSRVVERLAPQCAKMGINGPEELRELASSLETDLIDEAPFLGMGPLAGIRAAIGWARGTTPGASHVLIAPVDMPFLPGNLVARLSDGLGPDEAAIATSTDGRAVPVLGLWPLGALEPIECALREGGDLSVRRLLGRIEWRGVVFPAADLADVNDPAALAVAEARIAAAPPRP